MSGCRESASRSRSLPLTRGVGGSLRGCALVPPLRIASDARGGCRLGARANARTSEGAARPSAKAAVGRACTSPFCWAPCRKRVRSECPIGTV